MLHQGFLLTSHFRDTAQGLELSFYGKSAHGPFKLIFPGQKIVFFIKRDTEFNPPQVEFERKPGKLQDFSHEHVDTIYLSRYQDLQKTKDYCQLQGIRTFELDILPTERFLMERFINAQIEFKGDFTEDKGLKVFANPQIRPGHGRTQLASLSLDIETGVKGELYSIGLYFEDQGLTKSQVLMLADETKAVSSELYYFTNEKDILLSFLKLVEKWDPDLIIGWHVIGFDLMFLEKKFRENKIDFSLGRQNTLIQLDERKGMGFFADTYGRVILDGPPILRAAFYQFKNFKLETVASEVLGTGKDIASDAGKVTEIERRFREDKPALAKYNLLDCKLVTDIFQKLGIFELLCTRAKISGLLIDRLPVSTAAFDHVFLPLLHRKGYVAPNRVDISRDEASTGGMVIEPKIGRHHHVAVFDFKSLYPSIIMTFHIDPYSRIQADKESIVTPRGFHFSKDEHLLPEIIHTLMQERAKAKENHDPALSQAVKILMNSFYGVMGSSRCRFYHADLPSAITTTGHWILTEAMDFIQQEGYEVLYGDTDSIFVKFNESNTTLCQQLAEKLNKHLDQLITEQFGVISKLECEFEKLYTQVFFSQARDGSGGAKKRYAGFVNGNVEFKGMEFVRSDWTQLAKSFQLELYKKFFAGEQLETFIKTYIKDLEAGFFDDQLVYTKRLSKAPEEYTKNVPVHVKAALKVNHTGPYRLKEVSYVITKQGPEPINNSPKAFDYQHYIEKQLKPIADDILQTQNLSFDGFLLGNQLSFL